MFLHDGVIQKQTNDGERTWIVHRNKKKIKQTKENERFKIVQTIFIVLKQFPNRL